MRIPTVGIDVDGVLAHLHGELAERYFRKTGKRMVINGWNPTHLDGSECEKRTIESIFIEPGLWRDLPFYEGAVASVAGLDRISNVFFHTCPPKNAYLFYGERLDWLNRMFGRHDVVFTPDKGLLRADYFVDDRQFFINQFVSTNPKARTYLCLRPWSFENEQQQVEKYQTIVWDINEAACLIARSVESGDRHGDW